MLLRYIKDVNGRDLFRRDEVVLRSEGIVGISDIMPQVNSLIRLYWGRRIRETVYLQIHFL